MAISKKKLVFRRRAQVARGECVKVKSLTLTGQSMLSPHTVGREVSGNPPFQKSGQLVAEAPQVADESSRMDPSVLASTSTEPNGQAISSPEPVESSLPDKYRLPTISEANAALRRVSDAIRIRARSGGYIYHDLDHTTRDRFTAMRGCLSNFIRLGGKHFLAESLRAAGAQEKGATYARSIRHWIRDLIKTGDLPYYQHGWWNVPLLDDEDIGREIKAHLQTVGKFACAEDIVKFFLDEDTRTRLGVPYAISLRTAQRWMTKYGGFRWRKELKGQYFDGHERDDVVKYRQLVYIPFWRAIERLMTIFNDKGVPDPQ
ncbi:hypothetical protein RSOLAG22IIIB_09959 [Rhizoctonia solani]|uniref:Uncharacterized protein n=1 Tax=Rhizoctonia solani TaxID=456999 RepID=A0A0K6G0A3_9AGAM|nr:hypothetical protein RSOLAG22IIIB_09959 [Rhizoctonia solani]